MIKEFGDFYFFDFEEALKKSKKLYDSGSKEYVGICYYDGDKKETESVNLINLSSSDSFSFIETFTNSNLRIPTFIDTTNLQEHLQEEYIDKIQKLIKQAIIQRSTIQEKLIKKIKSTKLNFSEKLRVYMDTHIGNDTVAQVYRHLSTVLKALDFEVFLDSYSNLEDIKDDYKRIKNIEKFNPHITININRIRNNYLVDNCFNFIWFQDPTLILYDDSPINLRKNDFIFFIGPEIFKALLAKGIDPDKMMHQHVCPDFRIFKTDNKVARKNKIVFIGNDYLSYAEPPCYYKNTPLVDEIAKLFNDGKISKFTLQELYCKYKSVLKRPEHLEVFIYPAVVRQEVVKWICTQEHIDVEIYGSGWDQIEETQSKCKGFIEREEDLIKILNESKYSLVVHGYYSYFLKFFESCACGSIPVVFEDKNSLEKIRHRDMAFTFSSKEELLKRIMEETSQFPVEITKDISLDNMVLKIKKIVLGEAHAK